MKERVGSMSTKFEAERAKYVGDEKQHYDRGGNVLPPIPPWTVVAAEVDARAIRLHFPRTSNEALETSPPNTPHFAALLFLPLVRTSNTRRSFPAVRPLAIGP